MRQRPAWLFMLGAVGSAVLVNGLLYALDLRTGGQGQRSRSQFPLLPPAWVIGAVWTLLLALMGYVQARVLQRLQGRSGGSLPWLVPALFLNCLLYPAYTAGFTQEAVGVAGNLVTLGLSAYVAGRLHALTRLGSWLICAVVAWSAFASFATYRLPA